MKSIGLIGILVFILMIVLLALAKISSNHPKNGVKLTHQYNISNNQNKPDTAFIYEKEGIIFIKVDKQFYRAKIQ